MVYKIDQVSRITGLSQKRIRDYEKERLIRPARHPKTDDRLFSEFDVKQIKKIKYLLHKRGFTIPALRHLLTIAPGWKIFQCQEKDNCEAFKNPHKSCWEVLKEIDNVHYQQCCSICPVYLSRKTKKIKLLEKPKST